MEQKPVKLFWTGGWDSTFQLLRLLLIHGRRVIPFYLIDEGRRSTGIEILTMRNIRKRLYGRYPHIRGLLGSTQYFGVPAIHPDVGIDQAYWSIRNRIFIGGQFHWLSRFCKQHSITDMQLSIHRDGNSFTLLEDYVREVEEDSLGVFRVDDAHAGADVHTLFRYFSLPVFAMRKLEMLATVDERGWQEEMSLTWFCHNPGMDMKPCGKCNPCSYAINEGFGWRIPPDRRQPGPLTGNRS